MATKLPNAKDIVLGSNCRDDASREWETNSKSSAAGIGLTQEGGNVAGSVSSVDRNRIGIDLLPPEKQDSLDKPPRPPIPKPPTIDENVACSVVNEIPELSDSVDDPILNNEGLSFEIPDNPILSIKGLSTFKIPPRFIAGLDNVLADEDDSICDDNTVNISNVFRLRSTTVPEEISNGYGDVVAQVDTGAELTVTNLPWVGFT